MKRIFLRVLRGLAIVYLGLVAACAGVQRRLIYFPARTPGSEEETTRIALRFGLEPWRDAQGIRIGWRQIPPPGARASHRLIVFHGNAGNALDRLQYAIGFGHLDQGRMWQVFLFEYPGYDARPGKISETSFRAAGRAALNELAVEDPRPIYLAGESIGCGPACALAGDSPQKVAGVFLMTPFASLGEVVTHHYSWLPVNLILCDRWDNVASLRKYRGPVAIMIAGKDEIVTPAQGLKLFDGYSGPKQKWIDDDATHNTVANAVDMPWWREVSDFLLENSAPHLSPH